MDCLKCGKTGLCQCRWNILKRDLLVVFFAALFSSFQCLPYYWEKTFEVALFAHLSVMLITLLIGSAFASLWFYLRENL